MADHLSRRSLIRRTLAGGSLAGLGAFSFGSLSGGTFAAGAKGPGPVPLDPEIEPLVRLLEETPRDKLLEAVAGRIREGATEPKVLAALLLAGVRNVQPRPSVGYKFHTVLAVISYHLLGKATAGQDRWLPVFWGLDYFKQAQARDVREGDWTMRPVDESSVPPADKAADARVRAMQDWDEPAADAAAAAVARHLNPQRAFELFYGFGARDFRSIGHKAIYTMCARRVLDLIGWGHAEPVLRGLAYALLMHEDGNPAQRDAEADRPWRENQKRVAEIPGDWPQGKPSDEAVGRLLAVLRGGTYSDAAAAVVDELKRGTAPQSIWDAVFCGAAELQLRQPNIVSLHAVTTTRAIHYAYQTSREDRTRRLLLLQNAALLPMFRDGAGSRGRLADAPIDEVEPVSPQATGEKAVGQVFDTLAGDRRRAAAMILGYVREGGDPAPLQAETRRLLFLKGDGVHDYKFTSAALEDFGHVSPAWRGRYLAAAAMHLAGPHQRDNPLVTRTRGALG